MSVRSWVGRRRRAVASTTSLSVLSSVFVVAATSAPGVPVPDVALNDGSVWVTNSSQLLVGRLNRQIDELSSGLRAASTDFDVVQEAADVLVHDRAGGTLQAVDVAYAALQQEIAVPGDAQVALGGGTVAVLRAEDGGLWVRTVDTIRSLDVEDEEPDAELGAAAKVVVGKDGTAHGLSVERSELVSLTPGDQTVTQDLEDLTEPESADLTAVGDQPVVLDVGAGRLLVPGSGALQLDEGDGAVLQDAGPEHPAVLVATQDALLEVPLDGAAVRTHEAGGEGTPARPVRVGRCAHAAWSGSALYGRSCGTDALDVRDVPSGAAAQRLAFRVNRDAVVLNDLQTGNVWLLDDAMTLVSNWSDVTPPEEESDEDDGDALQEQVEAVQAERDQENRPPTAADDELGVRAGRSTLLPLLDNDSDPDGDVLTVTSVTPPQATAGTPQLVTGGAAVQIDVPADATGASSYTYEISDGRGGTAQARANVTVRPPDVNGAPTQLRRSTTTVELAGTTTIRVLPDFRDPDGDDLVLVSAVPTTADTVRYRPDGAVTFSDSGTTSGRKTVTLVVSDGREQVEGVLVVDVRPPGQLPPLPTADHHVTYVDRTSTVRPLDNDRDPNGDELRLSRVDAPADLQVTTDHVGGTFTVAAQRAGTFYATYVVTDGPGSAVGLVRIDVLPPGTENRAPVAVRDLALLPDGGKVLVDVLANDEDPDGDVLVVQQVAGAQQAGLVVATLDHRVLRITSTRALTASTTLTYTVSDGQAQSTGSVVVVPAPRQAQQQPPTALPDTATVRAGDVVTIPVLANDSHPDGDDITLQRELAQDVPAGQGLLFVDGQVLRYQAPEQPGTVTALYTIEDSQGQTASSQVTLYVRPAGDQNTAPQPKPVVARALAGTTMRIPVPLAGIDPDGDSVTLLGVDTAPTKGRVTGSGPDWLTYEAFPASSGTDAFTYAVVDRLGARATASIRVGIAARTTNQDPVAVDDRAVVRPGRVATVSVLSNDADPDGDVLRFADPALQVPAGVDANAAGETVVVRTSSAASSTIPYSVEDGRGGRATAFVTVEAREDAPLLAPVARDDVVDAAAVKDAPTVEVRVLDNDADADGPAEELTVELPERSRSAAQTDGRVVRVRPAPAPQVLAYSVVDGDGLRSYAFVFVAGTDAGLPELRPGAAVEVAQDGSVDVALADHVLVRAGRQPRLTQESRVSATNGDGSPLVVDERTLRYAPAPDFAGQASLTFEVTDGSGPDDAAGRTAVLTLPVTVLPGANRPPVWNGADLRVAPGEEAVTADLRSAVTDPDPDDAGKLTFSGPSSKPTGMDVRLDGSRLSVSVGADVARGTTATLVLTVTDGSTAPVPATVTVSVTASTRPLAKAVDDVVDDADQGRATTVDVLANDSNPFPAEPLSLAGAVLETGDGAVAVDGDQVRVTPAADFVGTMVARYTVLDATKDADRQVEGRVRLTVRGRPGTPAAPTVLEVRDRTVVLTWAAPAANGAPITSYRVEGQGYSRSCPSTTCTLDGLTNDVEYRFTVTATNAVGDSDPSAASAPARPDVRPDRPTPPTLVFGDKSLQVSWTAPSSPGSKIESYDLEISPAGSGGSQVTATGTSYTWTGLTNGQSYSVRLRAKNRAPEPSDFSEYSRPEVPAGVPTTPAAPKAEPTGGNIGGQVAVTWSAPESNGASIDSYDLQVFKGGSLTQTVEVPGTSTSQTVTAENANDYTFRVVATNKAGPSSASPASSAVRPFGQPARIASVQASESDRASTLSFSAPSDNGKAIARYEYRVNGGAVATLAADKVVRGLTNGTTYQFEVRACNDYCAEWSPASNPVVPYGPVGAPSVTGSDGPTSVNFRWSPPSPNGRAITDLYYTVNGGGQTRVPPSSGSASFGNGCGQSFVMQVWARDAAGQVGPTATAGASTHTCAPRTVTVLKGESAQGKPYCSSSACAYILVEVANFAPNTTYRGVLTNSVGPWEPNLDGSFTLTTDSAGNGRVDTKYYFGYPGETVTATVDGVSGSRRW